METFAIFAPVGNRPGLSCTDKLRRFFKPVGGKVAILNLNGFRFIWRAVRAKLWPIGSLEQVNAPYGAGTMILFEGLFLFVFPCLKCWDTFCSLFFFFKQSYV